MKDFRGLELNIGDAIAYQRGGRYPDLIEGTVLEERGSMVRVLLKYQYREVEATVNTYKIAKLAEE